MPYAAPSIRACGCVVAPGDRCPHMIQRDRERKARHDAERPTARERGYDSKFQKARDGFLKSNPRCERCGAPATILHHITPHRGDKKLFWDRKNWAAVCKPCHDGPIQSQEKRNAHRR